MHCESRSSIIAVRFTEVILYYMKSCPQSRNGNMPVVSYFNAMWREVFYQLYSDRQAELLTVKGSQQPNIHYY